LNPLGSLPSILVAAVLGFFPSHLLSLTSFFQIFWTWVPPSVAFLIPFFYWMNRFFFRSPSLASTKVCHNLIHFLSKPFFPTTAVVSVIRTGPFFTLQSPLFLIQYVIWSILYYTGFELSNSYIFILSSLYVLAPPAGNPFSFVKSSTQTIFFFPVSPVFQPCVWKRTHLFFFELFAERGLLKFFASPISLSMAPPSARIAQISPF